MSRRTWLGFIIVLLVNYLVFRFIFPNAQSAKLPYSVFKDEAAKGNIARIYSRGDRITGAFKTPVRYPLTPDSVNRATPRSVTDFTTTLPVFADPHLESLLVAHGTEISADPVQQDGGWLSLLLGFAPAILIIGAYVWLFRRAGKQGGMGGGGGIFGIGKSNARRFDTETDAKVTFADVAGIDEAENELVEIVDFLKNPQKYTRLGGAAPKGVLLGRRARDGEDAARAGRGRRSGRAVLLDGGLGVRGDDRGRRSGARSRSVQAGARERAGDHLHRRAGFDWARARPRRARRRERAGANAQSSSRRDGRVLEPSGHDRAGGDEPTRRARQGPASARAV